MTNPENGKQPLKPTIIILGPEVEPHDDPSRIIGRRTRYHGDEHRCLRESVVVIVAVLKDALRVEEYRSLKNDDEIRAAGGVGPHDRVEVAPFLPEVGRLSFVTYDPKAVDLELFEHLRETGE